MKTIFFTVFFVLGFSFFTKAQNVPGNISDSLQKYLDNFLLTDNIPGGIMTVHSRSGNWTWKGMGGLANISTFEVADTSFFYRIGSISKNFMAVTILHLADKGILSLNDSIGLYLHDTLLSKIMYSEDITIKHLLNHTSGIYSYTDDLPFMINVATNPNANYTPDDLISIALNQPPDFLPGEDYKYNNTGFVILTKIIEEATGVSYHRYATDSIINPLALNNTYFPDTNVISGAHMRCYADLNYDGILEDYTNITTTWALGAGEIVSNLDDQIKYFNALLDGMIITQNSYNDLCTPLPNVPYGLGTYVVPGVLMGHAGGYFSTAGLWYLESVNAVIAFHFNLLNVDYYNNILLPIYNLLLQENLILSRPSTFIMSLYPNPAKDYINVQFNNSNIGLFEVSLLNIHGQVILNKISGVHNSIISIDTRNVKPGVYFVKISNSDVVEIQRIIIQ